MNNQKFENWKRNAKKAKASLVFACLIFGVLAIVLVLAYPILDSGITDTLQEDTLYSYNFTQNVTYNPSETLTFSIIEINSSLHNYAQVSDYYWISINSSIGNMTINATHDNETGNFTISIEVVNQIPEGTIVASYFNITAVNDAPAFSNLGENRTLNRSAFELILSVTDEENDVPFTFNVSFLSCTHTALNPPTGPDNCTLFNLTDYNGTATNISFTPADNQKGEYEINFSVTDSRGAVHSEVVNWTLTWNDVPYFTYVCDNERNATEDSEFTCWINATDTDELNNLTFIVNYTWFTFNGTSSNSIVINTTEGNASALVNFTPTDTEVGNWSVNVNVIDTCSPTRLNSTIFWFFINNTEDNVTLDEISNYTIYENKTIYVNATDDDLLVPDKNVKNEILTFASNTSWVSISTYSTPSGVNYTTAKIEIDFDSSPGQGNYTVKVNVTDTAGSTAERNFTIQISSDSAPEWNETMADVFVIYENNLTYMNFSENVTDADSDDIIFSFTNDSAFPSFSINSTTGVINFTPTDADVGYHNITINATDGMLNSLKSFNFTIYNVNDAPDIQTPLTVNTGNATADANSNINTSEDNLTIITLSIVDNDIKIPSSQIQNGFYNESLDINLIIQGPNSSLFNFSLESTNPANALLIYQASFTPSKLDVGSYNVTINVTDNGNVTMGGMKSDFLSFNLTIGATEHNPVLMGLTNQTSAVNRSFYYNMNASDIEDGDDASGNLTFKISFLQGINFINNNETIFNTTSGVLNITFNDSQTGKYHLNITVNDTNGNEDSGDFWLFVYDTPNITYPLSSHNFSLQENVTYNLNFTLNHSVGDNLTYLFYIDNILRNNISYYGNGTNFTWEFTPNFTDETYGLYKNLTLIVYASSSELENRTDLNKTVNWNINISHTNSPLEFLGTWIGGADKEISGGSPQIVTLSDYFSDLDASDSRHNQTVRFSVDSWGASGYVITSSVVNWINGSTPLITFSSSGAGSCNYKINVSEYNESNSSQVLSSVQSNNFSVELTVTIVETPVPTSGGGGATRPVSLKIILPDPISAYKKERIIVPITLSNSGKVTLSGINLTAIVAKGNLIRKDILTSFDKSYFSSLSTGKKENTTLTINISTEEIGLYEITINASVKSPKYNDWGKLYLTVKEANKTEVLETIVFTEEFIAENPECIEIKEITKEARKYFEIGDYTASLEKSREAIEACRYAIAQPALPALKVKFENKLYKYLSLSFLGVFAIGISYYFYKRIKFKRALIK